MIDYGKVIYLYAKKYNVTSDQCAVGREKICTRIKKLRAYCMSKGLSDITPPEYYWNTFRDIKRWIEKPDSELNESQIEWKQFHNSKLVPLMTDNQRSVPRIQNEIHKLKRRLVRLETELSRVRRVDV